MGSGNVRLLGLALIASALGCGCQTTRLSEEERQRQRQDELVQERDYLKDIQSLEDVCFESLDRLGEVVTDFNVDEAIGYSGAVFATKRFYPYDLEEAVEEGYMGDHVSVRYIVEGSPADRGGLLVGDRLLELNGVKVPKGERATRFAVDRMRDIWEVEKTNELLVDRNGVDLALGVEAKEAAMYSVVVTPFLREGVVAEGRTLYFSKKTIEGLEEEEVDYLCAFAMVQNVMKHARMKGQNEFLGGMLDIAAVLSGVNTGGIFSSMGRNAHKAGFLVEADLLALYALAMAGIDISGYAEFWEARFSNQPKGIDRVSQQRLDSMRQVIAEIEAKRARGEPIYPTEYLAGEWSLDDEAFIE